MKTNNNPFLRYSGLMSCLLLFVVANPVSAASRNNTKTGVKANAALKVGKHNTANGFQALLLNKTGSFNTALGSSSLRKNKSSSNVAVGFKALFSNSDGSFNVAIGNGSLLQNTTGNNNIGIGVDAGGMLTTGSDNICIDHPGVAGDTGIIRIGRDGTHTQTFIAGKISGDGSGLTGIGSTQITPGSITSSSLTTNLTLSGTTTGAFTGAFAGSGAGLTSLNANTITAGTLSDAVLSGNVALRNVANAFTSGTANNTFTSTGSNATVMSGQGRGSLINVNAPELERHVVSIVSTQEAVSSCLALQVGDSAPNSADNFITFFNAAGGYMGRIEAVNATTTSYITTGADFAEILPMSDSSKALDATEIVPVHAGQVGDWSHADQFMVVSNQAGFIGNSPGKDAESEGRHQRIAFLGQVPVKVHGTVNAGDYIIASEKNDGTGIAKSAQEVEVAQMNRVVGRAWEASDLEGLKTVNTAVGLDQTSLVVPTLQRLERENQELRLRLQKLESRLNDEAMPVRTVLNQ